MFTLRQDTDCDTHELIGCDCTKKRPNVPLGLDDYDFDVDDESEFQVNVKYPEKNETHKTVDQLMEWQHFGRPFSSTAFEVVVVVFVILLSPFFQLSTIEILTQDVCLGAALKHLTFVLRCESGIA